MHSIINEETLSKFRTIAIYGSIRTGKTALSYKILEQFKKPVYILNHPNKHLVKEIGYKNLYSLEEVEHLRDCVIYWDEPQLSVNIQDKKSNLVISKVCSLAGQLGITMLISTSDTRVFGKSNEAYFDIFLIKDLDYEMVKNGSKIKQAIRKNARFDPYGFRLKVNEFIVENRLHLDLNGRYTFNLPKTWNEELSKPYRYENTTEDENPAINAPENSGENCD